MSDLDRISTLEVGMPGPSGAGITSPEKTTFDSRLDALEAGASIVVEDEGTPLTGNAKTLNFVGSGVTASGSGDEKTITIPGTSLTVQEGDVTVASSVTTLDFNDNDFNLTESPTGEINVNRNRPATIFANGTKDSSFSSVTTSEGTIHSITIGPGSNGIIYDIEMECHIRGGPDSSGYLRLLAKIESDASVSGERTGTVGGERSCQATARKLSVTGDGVTTYTLYARGQMDTGTGTVSSCHIRGRMIPR